MMRARLGVLLAVATLAAGCSSTPSSPAADGSSASVEPAGAPDSQAEVAGTQGRRPLRAGESFRRLAMPAAYTPSAPFGKGTDDYRCFLLDPELSRDAFITGLDVVPGTEDLVHHVILFRVPPRSVPTAQAQDAAEDDEGWTCFGGAGIDGGGDQLDNAPWLGAWAPGGGESLLDRDVGIPLKAGSQVIMQVHYNLLAGQMPDVTAARLRLAPADKDLAPLETVLLPAPVELPCRPGHDESRLCDRAASLADVQRRFGGAGSTANLLHLLCGEQQAGPVQRCDRAIGAPATLRAVAGHMHLLGMKITIEVNPGTPRSQTVLDIPVWNFDDQAFIPVDPLRLGAGDTVRVTCEHDQSLRDVLSAFDGQPERWVLWGEGTTDEMCLGILMLTRP